MKTYKTLNGHEIVYDSLNKTESAFLARAQEAADNPGVTTDQMIALVYGRENPILDSTHGHPMVTPHVLDHPLYRILSDLIGVKRVQLGQLDLAKAHAKFTLDVPAAAAQLGVTPQSVRAAIDTSRLPGIFRNGQWWLSPDSVGSYQVSKRAGRSGVKSSKRGIREVVAFVIGHTDHGSLSVEVDAGVTIDLKEKGLLHGTFNDGWKRAMIKTTSKSGTRVFEIESASGAVKAIDHAGMLVKGSFELVKKYNDTKRANEAWVSREEILT